MTATQKEKLYGKEHARLERQYFYKHVGIFIFAQLLFIFLVGLVPAQELPSGSYFLHMKEWILNKKIGFYQNETINTMISIWTSVLIIHFIWAMSYILFPKKKRISAKQETRQEIKEEVKKEKEISINSAWMYLVFGGLIEIYWATGLKTNSMSILTLIAILVSFNLLIEATKKIPIGTAYAVFTGIGTVGTILVDILYFKEAFSLIKILLVCLLALFIIGLKFSGDKEEVK
ncbi:TPA: multidrug efflux SMR transporter [Bacillus cereus]|uniref:SugE protein n=1 Tax=Bacillus cereus (strain B4264) TaxID=405532 RepID=B7H9G3_BACC4|nr:multidrug efflux SMR transporter [Bacillus cereus]MRD44261.1 QacE family quaternary ammonium compound efflux SMR transporter [Bacillus thuringiensis]ACK59556.1 SugE protein [Bacillus cereus B4264]MBR9670098.1 QacE family quaternary ammonium compound efflux SMR transporter [Bacillus cereus]MEB2587073.1 multidrug efflux SMR transporter [Bacillus cereus]MEB2613574.1 multidrug efflux SMR transporter [Bacillus cereus]